MKVYLRGKMTELLSGHPLSQARAEIEVEAVSAQVAWDNWLNRTEPDGGFERYLESKFILIPRRSPEGQPCPVGNIPQPSKEVLEMLSKSASVEYCTCWHNVAPNVAIEVDSMNPLRCSHCKKLIKPQDKPKVDWIQIEEWDKAADVDWDIVFKVNEIILAIRQLQQLIGEGR